MDEQAESGKPTERTSRHDSVYPQGRTEREMGTHEGGSKRPPHRADELHGDLPEKRPPTYEGG